MVRSHFQRTFTLPVEVDANKSEATFENGILTITMPKSEASKPRKIQVKQGQGAISGQSGHQGGNTLRKETVPVQSGEQVGSNKS